MILLTGAPLARSRYGQSDSVVIIVVSEHFVWCIASTEVASGSPQDLTKE